MEEVTALELSSISWSGDAEEDESLSEGKYEDYEVVTDCCEYETEELPESVLSYLQIIKRRSENTEKLILRDMESDSWLVYESESTLNFDLNHLAELASEFGQDPETLKKQVLADIEEEEKREQMSGGSSNHHVHNTVQEILDADKLDNQDIVSNMEYAILEERCKQKLHQWEDEHKKLYEVTSNTCSSYRETIGKQSIANKEDWRKVEKEMSELNIIYEEQQKKLDEDLQKKQEVLAEELEKKKKVISKMKADLEKEINILEEQKTEAKKHLEEIQYKSAVKIQATYRAFYTYKKYAPFLKEKKEEKKRKEELKHKLEQEKREMEERLKLKLEDKKRRDEEKKQKEEIMKREMEEASLRERMQQDLRQREYEKKKSEERQRLEKAKFLKEEQKNKLIRPETEKRRIMSENRHTKTTHDGREDLNKELAGNSHLGKEIDNNVKDTENGEYLEIQEKEMKLKDSISGENLARSGLINLNEQVHLPEEVNNKTATSVTKVHCSVVADNLSSAELPVQYGNKISLAEDKKQCMLQQNPGICLDISNLTLDKQCIGADIMPYLLCQGTLLEQPVIGSTKVNAAVQKGFVLKEHSENTLVSVSSRSLVFPDHIEEKRLAWMKSCKPWANILRNNQRKKTSMLTKQRKGSAAKKLSPLNEKLIFQNGPWRDLKQVTTVILQDLPGCSLTTLSKCTKLRYLSMRRCNLITLEGLRDCKNLEFIDVQENCINVINCEDMENLKVLILNKNQISSIHGVENCTNLLNLELSFNMITRIGGVESLRNLQRLVLDHNQLISARGLQAVPMLLYLDCSYNYLTELEGIQNCGLLQILKLQGNNLCEFPKLDNHVLLRELYLDDNSISAVKGPSVYWLPLLQILSISQNSLAQMESLNTFISLEELDLSNNCLSDLQSIGLWLEGCVNLKRLLLTKNPLTQEANWRCTLLKKLPGLRLLNDEHLHPKKDTNGSYTGPFLAFCQAQIQVMREKWQMLHACSCTHLKDLESYCDTLKELMRLSSEHRYSHEYGDIEDTEREDPEILANIVKPPGIDSTQHNSLVISGANENKQDDSTRQITFRQRVNSSANCKGRDQEKNNELTSAETKVTVNTSNTENVKNKIALCATRQLSMCMTASKTKEHSAAIIIQSHWRGYVIRRDIDYYTRLHKAASVIQCAWRKYSIKKRYLLRKKYNKSDLPDTRNWAATVIQAVWKGFYLRKKLAAAFAAIEREELEDDFKEVNLDDFAFYENELEKEWILDSSDSPSAILNYSNKSGQPKLPKAFTIPEDGVHSLLWHPVEAWQGSDTPETNSAFTYESVDSDSKLEKQNVSHVASSKSTTDVSFRSEREEKISQEWGFKDSATAHLMLKRAQKMKSKRAKSKKMLDPAVRLALFKNNENKHVPVKPPKKVQPTKVDYFQEEYSHLCDVPSESLARSRDLTYQWLHTQCGEFRPASPKITKCGRFLPELNHDILNGGRVQLVANASKEDMDLEIVSVNSGSDLMQNKPRSSGTHRPSAAKGRDLFTPLKTHSGPQRKERISFRDNPTQLSGGWGSGKRKREKTLK